MYTPLLTADNIEVMLTSFIFERNFLYAHSIEVENDVSITLMLWAYKNVKMLCSKYKDASITLMLWTSKKSCGQKKYVSIISMLWAYKKLCSEKNMQNFNVVSI